MSKTIIVSGASRGIGLEVVKILLQKQAQVVTLSRSIGGLSELEAKYRDQLYVVQGDVTDHSVIDTCVNAAISKFKKIDGLVLNHGVVQPFGTSTLLTESEWKSSMDVNFFSYLTFIKACIEHLRKANGTVVLVSSGAATNAYVGWAAYCVAKAGINMLNQLVDAEEPNVTTISLRPGVVATDMQAEIRNKGRDQMGEERHDFFLELHRQGKLLSPDIPGHVIAMLSLGAPKSLSGKFLSWDSSELRDFRKE